MDVAALGTNTEPTDGPEYCTVSNCTMKATDRYNQQSFCSDHLHERLAREY